jgi:hypothetical protein
VFLLSLISKHEMLRVGLVMADGSLLTGRQHQLHTQNLVKIEINERVFLVFVFITIYKHRGQVIRVNLRNPCSFFFHFDMQIYEKFLKYASKSLDSF